MMERPNYQANYSSVPPSNFLDNTVDTMMYVFELVIIIS